MPVRSAVFDDPTLVSAAGLVPAVALAQRAGLAELAGRHLSVPGGVGTAAGAKVTALVAGVVGCHRPNLQQGVLNKEQAGVDGRRLPVSLVPARRLMFAAYRLVRRNSPCPAPSSGTMSRVLRFVLVTDRWVPARAMVRALNCWQLSKFAAVGDALNRSPAQ